MIRKILLTAGITTILVLALACGAPPEYKGTKYNGPQNADKERLVNKCVKENIKSIEDVGVEVTSTVKIVKVNMKREHYKESNP